MSTTRPDLPALSCTPPFDANSPNQAMILPGTGLHSISLSAVTDGGNCTEKFVAALMTVIYQAPAPLPEAPVASCPCWLEPNASGVCQGIQRVITLRTLSPAPGLYDPVGKSYQQCIDPANWDPDTGRMAMSYCWRYACLPVEFSQYEFEAEITLERWNIFRMPGSATYDTNILATNGVHLSVFGPAKNASQGNVTFEGTSYTNIGNITLPPSGVTNFTFKWQVPVGFDDLSAAVTMDVIPGTLPPMIAVPTQQVGKPRCPLVPSADGSCPDGTTAAIYRRIIDGNATKKCIPNPYYDFYWNKYAFSMCWTYACVWPYQELSAYTITIMNITQYGVTDIPEGTNFAIIDSLKPFKVNASLVLNPANASLPALGPYTSDATIVVPTGGVYSLDIVYSIPGYPWLDANCGAMELRNNPAPVMSPGRNATPRTVVLPPSAVPPTTTVIVANFQALNEIKTQADLNALLAAAASTITAKISYWIITMPLSFALNNYLTGCSPASVANFTSQFAGIVGVYPDNVTATCLSFNTVMDSRRRSLLQTANPCSTPQIQAQVSVRLTYPEGSKTLDDVISQYEGALFKYYNTDTGVDNVCISSSFKTTNLQVADVKTATTRRSLAVTAGTSISQSDCQALANNVPVRKATVSCAITTAGALAGAPTPDASSSAALTGGAVAGIVIAAVVAVAVIGGVVAMFIMRKQHDTKARRVSNIIHVNSVHTACVYINHTACMYLIILHGCTSIILHACTSIVLHACT